jgi:hypothetical protein
MSTINCNRVDGGKNSCRQNRTPKVRLQQPCDQHQRQVFHADGGAEKSLVTCVEATAAGVAGSTLARISGALLIT